MAGDRIATLYMNNGEGGFIEAENTTFEGVSSGAMKFADFDGNGLKM